MGTGHMGCMVAVHHLWVTWPYNGHVPGIRACQPAWPGVSRGGGEHIMGRIMRTLTAGMLTCPSHARHMPMTRPRH